MFPIQDEVVEPAVDFDVDPHGVHEVDAEVLENVCAWHYNHWVNEYCFLLGL